MESVDQPEKVRVVPDAVVGAGMVLYGGQVVSAAVLGPYLEPLMKSGAIVWHAAEEIRPS